MYTEVPTNGDIAGMIALLVLLIVGLVMCFNYHTNQSSDSTTSHINDLAAWSRNYDRIQRRH